MKNIFILLWFLASYSYSQVKLSDVAERKIDSLNTLAGNANNIGLKMDYLYKAANIYLINGNFSQALILANDGLLLINKLEPDLENDSLSYRIKKNKVKFTYLTGLSNSYLGKYAKAVQVYKIAQDLAKKINYQDGVAAIVNSMGSAYLDMNENKQAIDCYLYAIKINEQLNNAKNIFANLRQIGNVYHINGEYEKALSYYNQALTIAKKANTEEILPSVYANIGVLYADKGNYSESLKSCFLGLTIAEKLNLKSDIGMLLSNIAVTYMKQQNNEKSLEYNFKSIKINEELNNKNGAAINLGNIAVIYQKQNQFQKAFQFQLRALQNYVDMQNKSGIAITLLNIGVLNNENKMEQKALTYYFKALEIYKALDYKIGIAYTSSNIGAVYIKSNSDLPKQLSLKERIETSETFFLVASDLIKDITAMDLLQEIHFNLSAFYTKKAEFTNDLQIKTTSLEKANYHIRKENEIKDSLFSQQSVRQFAEISSKFETEKKETENKILSQENELQKLEINKRNYFIAGLAGSVFLLFLLAILFIRQNKLKASQQTLVLEQKLLRTQLNPHFIFNSLNAIQNYIYKNDVLEAGEYLSKFATLMRMILNNSREEHISLDKEIESLQIYLELQSLRFENQFDFDINVSSEIESDMVSIPPMLAQPFIENAIEHGLLHKKEKGTILIRFINKPDCILFEVEDNGIGREKAQEIKKSAEKNHQSLALTITKERLSILNKNTKNKIELELFDLKNNDGTAKGTKVVFSIPFVEI